LNPIGEDRKQQDARQMIGRWSFATRLPRHQPRRAQTFDIETAHNA